MILYCNKFCKITSTFTFTLFLLHLLLLLQLPTQSHGICIVAHVWQIVMNNILAQNVKYFCNILSCLSTHLQERYSELIRQGFSLQSLDLTLVLIDIHFVGDKYLTNLVLCVLINLFHPFFCIICINYKY